MITGDRKSGLTLIELIVSLAITSVMAVFVYGFTVSLTELWRTTEGSVGTELDVQIALDTIEKDLESALFLEGKGPMFAVSAISNSTSDVYDYTFSTRWDAVTVTGSGRPSSWHFDPDKHHYGWAGSWLRFFTAAPSLNAVGYQLIRRPPFTGSSEPRYLLHRSLVRHDNSLAGGFDISTGTYSVGTTSDALKKPRLDSVILEDVVDFGVRLYVFEEGYNGNDDSPKGLRLVFPASSSSELDSTDTEHLASLLSGTTYSQRFPDVIEVFVRVLDDVGSELLLESEEFGNDLTYSEIYEKHSRLYRRMIRRVGRGL